MNICYLHKNNNPRLLLIYSGWSTDETAFSDIHCQGYDIAVVSDYSELTPLTISEYQEIVLIAWSLGVHAAELTALNLPLTLTIAVCGTPTPANDLMGIPVNIWQSTAKSLSEASLQKFRRRMGASALPRGNRSIESLQTELLNFPLNAVPFRWDRAIIADNDRIFPPENQRRAWQNRAEITEIIGPHTPDFQDIINRFVINKSLVGSRFSKGRATYDVEADVQHRIADHLYQLWQKHGLRARNILEIGAGNGYFTSLYSNMMHSADVTLWDLSPAHEEVQQVDAEVGIRNFHDYFDAIVSASTMQWFNSPAAFLKNVAKALTSNGLAVLSTFGPQTFRQLSQAGVIGLPYLSLDSLRRIVSEDFEILELHSGLITRVFNSPIDVLRHVQATGVNARQSTKPLRQILADYPQSDQGRYELTYEPIYMILRKL